MGLSESGLFIALKADSALVSYVVHAPGLVGAKVGSVGLQQIRSIEGLGNRFPLCVLLPLQAGFAPLD